MYQHSYSYHAFEEDSERLYCHLLNLREVSTPDEVIRRFQALFLEGTNYPEPEIRAALHRVVASGWAEQEFNHILSRCCHILLNYWWLQSHWWLDAKFQRATTGLIDLISTVSIQSGHSPVAQRLRSLVSQFSQTEQYETLKRRAWATGVATSEPEAESELVGRLIHSYSYLYPHCLLDWDSSEMGQQSIKQLQMGRERKFEKELFEYVNTKRRASVSSKTLVLPELNNPTLLTPDQLDMAIRQFSGKAEGSRTYQDSARQFLINVRQSPVHRVVKHQMYDYLTNSLQYSDRNPAYGKHRFNHWLGEQLTNILPQSDHLKPSEPLLVRTCAHLIDALLASPTCFKQHFTFIDLTSNLGATFTVGLLLKIVLLCRNGVC
jgi:hypothetical protein